jgi:3-(3-hydroxy-phenyl)propionate hydroxylase
MGEHAVVIVGGGPTGMMLAGELALAGVDVAILERRAGPQLDGSRAGGLHARTIEVLDQRGIAERFLEAGETMQVGSFSMIPLSIEDFPTRHNYGLALFQNRIEEIMAAWIDELPVTIHRGCDAIGLTQDESGVDVQLSDGSSVHAQYVVGCDGGRSVIRKAAGIDFPGWDPSVSSLIAEAEMTDAPERELRRDERGMNGIGRLDDGFARVVVREDSLGETGQPTLADLSSAITAVWRTDFGLHGARWISRFTDMSRQAASYREGRVLLAGDAAHIHSPAGGQGLGTGVQDAVNLGWKLAQVVKAVSPDSLLDTYHAERHPIGAWVLQYSMAQTALHPLEPRIDAVRDTLAELIGIDDVRRLLAGKTSGLGIRYDLGEGHPLLGRRMPDLDLLTAEGEVVRMFTLLHAARPVLLNLGPSGRLDAPPWVDVVDARHEGAWELPVVGEVDAPAAVLVRPDGYVGWVGEGSGEEGLREALSTWCGAP